ncbi:MAG: HAMP domain-containing histidine kinase [Moorea sp. SIO2B7]|nr:HAMP domain-containing histidine kinase [Moorena sp. SIO2B7]
MKLPTPQLKKISQFLEHIDPSSLRVRLTLGIATVSAIGLSGVAIWISLKMQHILVSTHKQNIQYIAERFPHDVKIYSDMVSLETGIQKAIDNLTTTNTLLWVKRPNNNIIAQSIYVKSGNRDTYLLSLSEIKPIPQIQKVNRRYWLLCATPLVVKDVNLGEVYIAQDITGDQTMFVSLMKSLAIASLLSIGGMTIAIAFYVQRSLQPLQRISQLTEKISADQLSEAHINLDNAPKEVRELAQTFDEMLVRLSEAWEHQRQLVSNVSHELRTPLTIVSGYLQSTLRRGDNLTQPQREALEIAASEADRTIQLMQDLLDLARVDSGNMHFNLEPLVLNDLVKEVVDMGKQYSNRIINLYSTNKLITIKVDANRLKQVLLNLIDNAVKYSDIKEPIIVKIDKQSEQATIQICDRGSGIPLQQQTRIFERFYRLDEARSRSGGTGLGLSIVKTLTEGMGGNISVFSELNKGSIFIVSFPAIASEFLDKDN